MGWKWNDKSAEERLAQARAEGKQALVVICDTKDDYKRLNALLDAAFGPKQKD